MGLLGASAAVLVRRRRPAVYGAGDAERNNRQVAVSNTHTEDQGDGGAHRYGDGGAHRYGDADAG